MEQVDVLLARVGGTWRGCRLIIPKRVAVPHVVAAEMVAFQLLHVKTGFYSFLGDKSRRSSRLPLRGYFVRIDQSPVEHSHKLTSQVCVHCPAGCVEPPMSMYIAVHASARLRGGFLALTALKQDASQSCCNGRVLDVETLMLVACCASILERPCPTWRPKA